MRARFQEIELAFRDPESPCRTESVVGPKDRSRRSVTCKIKDGEGERTDREEAMIKHIVEEIVTDMKKRCSLIKKAGF